MKRLKRMSGKKVKAALKFCIHRDGPLCKCKVNPARVLHHVDRDPSNNPADGSNWEGLCQSCNIAAHPRGKSKRGLRMKHVLDPKHREKLIERESESESESESERVTVRTVEMAKNMECEPKFREWLKSLIIEMERVSIDDIVNGGAEVAGCSQQAIKRYLDKVCSFTGEFEKEIDEFGKKRYVIFRKGTPGAKLIEQATNLANFE